MSAILPGATLGMLGSGQLGRMFAIEARRLGYRVHVFSPDSDTPAGEVANRSWVAEYDDEDSLKEFANTIDVVSLEFENIDVDALNVLEQFVPVRPGPLTLHTAQHRAREKSALRNMGLATAPFHLVHSADELSWALKELGEGILKTAAWGYDGKGQQRLTPRADAESIWQNFGTDEAVFEGLVKFRCEFSVIGVRTATGDMQLYGAVENAHANHILDVSLAPAPSVPERAVQRAQEMTRVVMEKLGTVGVLCIEFFLDEHDEPIINEIAPRPHNSGHLTIDAHFVCQFEQQVRAICGLPLGTTMQRQPAAMVNLLGDLWPADGQPNWEAALSNPLVKLHLYGKQEARAGRKMGHLTALGDAVAAAESVAQAARQSLLKR